MIITIISGGSGSINIQKGLKAIAPVLSINLIINGYDDGKSTGILRKLFPNTLGISDFRKNQILEYELLYGNNDIYKLLNHRFSALDPFNYIKNMLNKINFENELDIKYFLIENIQYFFGLEQSNEIIYEDFSFMNIIYCSLLHKNNNDMISVCTIIKEKLKLNNNIFINSNKNLTLNGLTQKGNCLLDEASIVDFNDYDDKIIDVNFNEEIPILDKTTENILLNSDIIIFSCGTQFSSLIPTYKTLNFYQTIKKCKASKFLVLNCDYDKDIINYTGNELLNKINEYLPLDNIQIVISDDINSNLLPNDTKYNYINIPSLIFNNKHNGYILWKYILKHHFNSYYNKNYVFDYDYTLYDKELLNLSKENIELIQKMKNTVIVSNNCYSNILSISNIDIYSNISNLYNGSEIIDYEYILDNQDIEIIKKIIFLIVDGDEYIIQNRKNISISIKPILNRNEFILKLNTYLIDNKYEIIETGKTTIEIIKKGLSKRKTLMKKGFFNENYTYVTDKNDIEYNSNDNIKYFEVKNIIITNLFLKSVIINDKYDFCIIVGGINKRMEIDYPKCLVVIDNENILIKIINNILPFANNIFICGNNYYKNYFYEFEKKINYENIKFLYFNSNDNTQTYPKGNGETIYQLLNSNLIFTNKLFIMWGDIFISNNKIFEEMYNLQSTINSDFFIPSIYEKDPYAYLIINENNSVNYVEYKKNKPTSYGYHDQCIFLCNTNKIKEKINIMINQKYDELNFLDIVKFLDNVNYYETKYIVNSFNEQTELIKIYDDVKKII